MARAGFIVFVGLMLVVGSCGGGPSGGAPMCFDPPAPPSPPSSRFPLRTEGRYVVDAFGARFKLASVNWFGGSDEELVVGGLETATIAEIIDGIRALGFNSVRLPFSSVMLHTATFDAAAVAANPELVGLTPLEVYDRVVEALTAADLVVILNNHTTHPVWCCNLDADGLWYTSDYTEEQWLDDWAMMAARYRDNPRVVGADLRNEVRTSSSMLAAPPDWGRGTNDWREAAEIAGNRVLEENPDLLVIVEGVNFPRIHLQGVAEDPIRLDLPNRLVYGAHNYGYIGPSSGPLLGMTYGELDWPTFEAQMDLEWGYVIEEARSYTAPVWVSEFGLGWNATDTTWWDNLVRYLEEGDFDFAYWALNPERVDGTEAPYGLLESDWITPRDDFRTRDLARLASATTGPGVEPGWRDAPVHRFDVLRLDAWSTNHIEPHVDWRVGAFKATCGYGSRVVGMSAGTSGLGAVFASTVLCSDFPDSLDGTRCTLPNDGEDSPEANVHTGGTDWAPGSTKLECPMGQIVVGVAQTRSLFGVYRIEALLCASASVSTSGACAAVDFEAADDRRAAVPDDFDPMRTKGQCALEEYVAGVSLRDGHAHGLLCCPLP